MMKVPIMHRWTPKEVYRAFAEDLLKRNPGIIEREVRHTRTTGQKYTCKKIIGGYWGRRNHKQRTANYWIYTIVKDRSGKEQVVEVINYARWIKIMETYFLKAREYIVDGEELHLGGHMGVIGPRHIERNHANRKVNFAETKKQPIVPGPDGTMRRKTIIYFTEDSYVRVAWRRSRRIKGERTYEFRPSANNSNGNSFQQQFSRANQNMALRLKYPYFPYIKPAS